MAGHAHQGHTHDGVDWAAAVERLRANDDLLREEWAQLARRLVQPQTRVVLDVGSGAGGMSAAFAEALAGTGGTVVLVDSVPELLAAAETRVRAVAAAQVEVRAVSADAGSDELLDMAPQADLVFASFVVHHLPDQQRGLNRLARLLSPGGRLAVVESGLEARNLPWDLGVGKPGLEGRLRAARGEWFGAMRAGIDGSVRLPVGWNVALADAGLVGVSAFSYLVDKPPPPTDEVRKAVLQRLSWLRELTEPRLSDSDRRTLDLLLDPHSAHYLGRRDDVFVLDAATVYLGTAPGAAHGNEEGVR
ncbi:MAG: class I SAM-dependent methyltransferase [Actinobacteria bacterium]|nr:class I SAM-dependent methyltransferase [Actinomycetota bacterium]